MAGRKGPGRGRPLYMISVAARLTGLHPQTLRIYERRDLICPQRSAGNTRLYSDEDIERLRLITRLTEEGVNLTGVVRILEMQDEMIRMRRRVEGMRAAVKDAEKRTIAEVERVRRSHRAEIVHVRQGSLAHMDPRMGGRR